MRVWLFCLLFLCYSTSAFAIVWESPRDGDFSLMVAISNDHPTIGDQVTIQITASAPAAYRIDDKALQKQIMKHFNIVSQRFSLVDASVAPQKVVYTILPKVPGNFYINLLTVPFISETLPPRDIVGKMFPLIVKVPSTSSQSALSWSQDVTMPQNSWHLSITSDNQEKYFDGQDELNRQAYRNRKIFEERNFPIYSFMGIIGSILLVFILKNRIFLLFRAVFLKPRNFQEETLKLIDGIKANDEACHEKVSHLLKQYVEEKHHVIAITRTTRELNASLKSELPFPVEKIDQLNGILMDADLIKFADRETDNEERMEALSAAKHFVETT